MSENQTDPYDMSAEEVLSRRRRGLSPEPPHDPEICGIFAIQTCSKCLRGWEE